jgi:hypothetical protein
LAVLGTGPVEYSECLIKAARLLGLTDAFVLKRNVTDAVRDDFMKAADIFVSPVDSMQESFGLTPVEAMACGIPQVVADWSGYRETVIDGVTGFHIPTTWCQCDDELSGSGELLGWVYDHVHQGQAVVVDTHILEKRLQLLIENAELRETMAKQSRIRAEQEFSHKAIAQKYDVVWREVMRVPRAPSRLRAGLWSGTPAYYRCFKHFATHELRDGQLLRLASETSDAMVTGRMCSQAELPEYHLIDEGLLSELICRISKADVLSVAQLIEGVKPYDKGRIRRHISWLLKNELLVYAH